MKIKKHIKSLKMSKNKFLLFDYLNASELNSIYNCSDLAIWYVQPAITIQQASTGLNCIIPDTNAFTHFKINFKTF